MAARAHSVPQVVAVVLVELVDAVHAVLLRVAPDALQRVVADAALGAVRALVGRDVGQLVLWQHRIRRDLQARKQQQQ